MQGFSPSVLKASDPPLTFANYMDLAGNAFNGAVVTAVLLATFVAVDWGRLKQLTQHFQSGAEMDEESDDFHEEGADEDFESFEPDPVIDEASDVNFSD